MTRIVVGVDGSEGAAEALRWAAREAERHGGRVTAVLAWGYLDQHHTSGEAFDARYGEADARAALEARVRDALGDDALGDVDLRPVCDLPARALLEAAEDADLLVVGARGLGGFRGLLLGSVSRQCLHHARTPVAIVRTPEAEVPEDGPVVVGVDGSDTARRALDWAAREARVRRVPLVAVHAWDPAIAGGYPFGGPLLDLDILEQAARRVLDEAVAAVDTEGLVAPVDTRLVCGNGTSAILDAAVGAGLVVVGSRGLSGFKGLLLGSISSQVSHHAAGPVVVVPPGG